MLVFSDISCLYISTVEPSSSCSGRKQEVQQAETPRSGPCNQVLTAPKPAQIDAAGDFGLRVYSAGSRAHRIVPVDVAPAGAQFVITVGKPSTRPPPYRIDNRHVAQALAGLT